MKTKQAMVIFFGSTFLGLQRVLLLFALSLSPMVVCADLVVCQKAEHKVGFYLVDEEKTIRINGDKAREDTVSSMTGITNNGVAPSMPGTASKSMISVIKDLRTGDSITLMELYGQKWAVKISGASARQMAADEMRKMSGRAKPSPPQNSDITSLVGGYQTEIYNWTNINGVSMKLWVARGFPTYKKITGQLEKVYGLISPDTTKGWIRLDPTTLPGMVMKSETEVGGTNLITTTLISAKEEPVDASAFVIPKDYQVMDSQQTH